jgi:hypothetical protein
MQMVEFSPPEDDCQRWRNSTKLHGCGVPCACMVYKDEVPDCCCWKGYANGWVFATWRQLPKMMRFLALAWYIRIW